eukprot:Skav219261  [mRNA]  locus=scaffold1380:6406:13059:- [translate_table: standard]
MGLLKIGTPLHWKDSLEHCNYVRLHGIHQFIATYPLFKQGRSLQQARSHQSTSKDEIEYSLLKLDERQKTVKISLRGPEVMESLRQSEQVIHAFRGCTWHQEYGSWMLEGTPDLPYGGYTMSLASVEQNMRLRRGINPHPRFATLTGNIRRRRGAKVDIRVPLYQDIKTPEFKSSEEVPRELGSGFWKVLAVLAPIMMALTAATPIVKGRLAATDVRWSLISQSVDDRTPAERGEASAPPDSRMAGGGVTRQTKSRYDSISCYIHPGSNGYSDIPCEIDEELQALLQKEGIDDTLAKHIAHLFTRDPLATRQHQGLPEHSSEHKFRSMEVQLTDFENAAFTAFIVIAPWVVGEPNMKRAHGLDAVRKQKFWFRKHILPDDTDDFMSQQCPEQVPLTAEAKANQFEEMTMDEIMNGKSYAYLEHIGCDETSFRRLDEYLKLIKARATGHQLTPATWMRNFVHSHRDYQKLGIRRCRTACNDIGLGKRACPELLGEVKIEPITAHGQYETPLYGERLGPEDRDGIAPSRSEWWTCFCAYLGLELTALLPYPWAPPSG